MAAKPFVFGGLASLTAEFGTFPIDTTKIRLQVQGQVKDIACQSLRYRGMLHALLRIYQEEGMIALYSGIAPALLRQASYGTLKIGLYHYIKRLMDPDPKNETLGKNVLAGMTSGALASAVANPTDVLKVRMQAATSKTFVVRKSCVRLFSHIYKEEGMKGLYRGVIPTAQRAAGVAGVLLPSYDFFKHWFQESTSMGDTTLTHFCASFLAGLLGTMATNPLDVIKSRMMNQQVLKRGTSPSHIYTSSFHCFVTTLRTEGPMSLYKGFVPSYLRLGPWNIIFFITYEKLKVIF